MRATPDMTPTAGHVSDPLRKSVSIDLQVWYNYNSLNCGVWNKRYQMAEERVQRRLAAILAADVVGYSRLMELDEAGTLAALKARRAEILQPLVAKHHGRDRQVMGDGVLVEFASAVDAVDCAVAAAAGNGGRRIGAWPMTGASCCASASTWAT